MLNEQVVGCFYLRAAISDCLLFGFIRATETLGKGKIETANSKLQ
jgi:hypothetical protein